MNQPPLNLNPLTGAKQAARVLREGSTPREFKLVALRECPVDSDLLDTPERAADYWRRHVTSHPHFNPEVECLAVFLLNTRRRIRGHYLVSIGTMDTLLVHAREIYRLAVIGSAAAILVAHNHPSGDPTPSEADIRVTRDLIRAGQLLKVELLDHIILGRSSAERPRDFCSLRECGYFYT